MIHQVVFCFLVTFFSPAVAAEEAEAPEAEVSTETTADLESTVSQVTTETLGESSAITTDQIGEEPEEKPEYAVAAAVAANPVEAGKDIARDPERLIRTVLELAGIKKHIDDIPGLVMSQLLHRRDELDPAVFSRAEKIIKEAYDQEDLFRSAVNKLKRKYDQARFLAVLQSLQDPVLSKIIEAERLAEGPESEKQREKFIAGLENMPIKQERINLLMLVDYTCGKSALAIKMQTKSLRDFLQVYNHCVPAASRYSPEAIEAAAKKLQVKLQSAAKNSALINLIFTYYGISDQELAEYLKFYDSDNAKWILRATEEDLGLAWGIAAERAGKAAVRLPASENPEKK